MYTYHFLLNNKILQALFNFRYDETISIINMLVHTDKCWIGIGRIFKLNRKIKNLYRQNSGAGLYRRGYNFFQDCQIREVLVLFDTPRRAESKHTKLSQIRQFLTKL